MNTADIDALADARVPFVLPQLDVSTFTGREDEIHQLERLLLNPQGSRVCSIVGLSGGGGIGKSALACHFATVHRDKFPDGVIGLRVDGKDVDNVAREFVRRCGEEIDTDDNRKAETLMQEVFAHRQMLLIFDNAEEASINRLRPSGNQCAVIVTTRRRNLPFSLGIGKKETIDLLPLPEVDALKLLKKLLGSDRVENAVAATKRLVKLVGNLPLALQVLGSALQGQRESLDVYANALEEEKDELFEELKVDVDRDLNVEASLNLSLRSLSGDEVDFFACLSVCAAEGFIKQTAMAATGCERNLLAQRRLKQFYDLSLLNYVNTGENRFVLHPLVRNYAEVLALKRGLLPIAMERHARFFLEWIQSQDFENENAITQVVENLDDVILAIQWLQNHESETENGKREVYEFVLRLQPLFEQYGDWRKAIKLMGWFQSWAENFEDWNAVIKYQMHEARYWSFTEDFKRSEEILSLAQSNLQKIEDLGQRKRREAKLLNVLAGVYEKQGESEKAIKEFRSQIFIDEEIGDDKALGFCCGRLGKLLHSQGYIEDAKQTFERGIEVAEAINNPSIWADCLNKLGLLLKAMGSSNQDEAIDVLNKSASIFRDFGKYRRAAIVYVILGGLYIGQKRFHEALRSFKCAEEIHESIESSRLIGGFRGLARIFHNKRDFKFALQAVNSMISICAVTNNQKMLAIAYHSLGKIEQANKNLVNARKAFESEIDVAKGLLNDKKQIYSGLYGLIKVLHLQNQDIDYIIDQISKHLNDHIEIARILYKVGKAWKEKIFLRYSIKIFEDESDLSNMAQVLNTLFGILEKSQEWREAKVVLRQRYDIAVKLNKGLDIYKIDEAKLLNHEAEFLESKGNLEKAENLLKQSLEIFENANDLPSFAKIRITLSNVLEKQHKWEDAEKILRPCYGYDLKLDDKLYKSIVCSKLGRVIANKKGNDTFKLSQMYFRESLQLAEELDNKVHLSKVNTAMGLILLTHKYYELAIESLSKGFEIDVSLVNIHGLKIVTPNLAYALIKSGNLEKALIYCDRALEISPNWFLQLRDQIQKVFKAGNHEILIKTGTVLYIRYSEKDKLRWGRITPDVGSSVIIFNEKFIDSETLSKLTQGTFVEFEIKVIHGKFYASKIRVIEDKEPIISQSPEAVI